MFLVPALHDWNVPLKEASAIQKSLAARIRQSCPIDLKKVDLIAGVDVSSSKESPLLTAGVVVWSRESGEIVDSASAQSEATFPYIPGYLSFREIPSLLEALSALQTAPEVFLVDGHGRAHPRRLGIAAHLGVLLEQPTIGVAKSRLIGKEEPLGMKKGSVVPLFDGLEQIGAVVRTRDNVSPVYVSVGNRIDLASAVTVTIDCTRGYRLPEPSRLAHNFVNAVRRGEIVDPRLPLRRVSR